MYLWREPESARSETGLWKSQTRPVGIPPRAVAKPFDHPRTPAAQPAQTCSCFQPINLGRLSCPDSATMPVSVPKDYPRGSFEPLRLRSAPSIESGYSAWSPSTPHFCCYQAWRRSRLSQAPVRRNSRPFRLNEPRCLIEPIEPAPSHTSGILAIRLLDCDYHRRTRGLAQEEAGMRREDQAFRP
jgi:hypothetical protein